MLVATYGIYDNNKDSFTNFPAAASSFSEIKSIAKEMTLNEMIIKEGTKGKIVSRDDSQSQLVQSGLVVAGALYGYAADNNDAELLIFSDVNSHSFGKLRLSEIPIFVEKLIDKADDIGDGLIPYGITAEKRTTLRAQLDDYVAKYAVVNSGKVTKKTARQTIKKLFAKADSQLKKLDKLMLGLDESNPELYSKYLSARVIIDKVSSHQSQAEEVTAPEEAAVQ